jgi:hypothetical protein
MAERPRRRRSRSPGGQPGSPICSKSKTLRAKAKAKDKKSNGSKKKGKDGEHHAKATGGNKGSSKGGAGGSDLMMSMFKKVRKNCLRFRHPAC